MVTPPIPAQDYEALTLLAWPALDAFEYDGWSLRSAEGHTGRANSVYPLGASSLPLAAKVAFVERWYAERGLPARYKLTATSQPPELDPLLAARGYERSADTLLQAAPLQPGAAAPDELAWLPTSEGGEWLDAYAMMSGKPPGSLGVLGKMLALVAAPLHYYLKPGVAAGLAIMARDAVMLVHLVVEPRLRGRGYGQAMVHDLLAWGHTQGAKRAFLQVTADNTPALRLYERFGFETQYSYWYRTAP